MPVRVQTEDFDLTEEIARLRAHRASTGATTCFIGTVRDISDGQAVSEMQIEHYPGMTEQSLAAIAKTAQQRWPGVEVLIVHRVGKLRPCDQIVLVATTAAHRGDAFASCEFVMDCVKTQAPFWKKETTPQGAHWVHARAADDAALMRWNVAPRPGR
jgi:molybdopterin synthase catalytic subunit